MASRKSSIRERLNKKEFDLIFQLYNRQPWLQEKHKAVLELLNLCLDFEEQSLLCDLLRRFKYLPSSAIGVHLSKMVSQIIDIWRLPEDETQILSITYDDEADSGQSIIQALKPEFAKRNWHTVPLINRIGKGVNFINERPNVVLVDEFIGSGSTMAQRIRYVRHQYEDAARRGRASKGHKIEVCVMASMEYAKDIVNAEGVDVFASLWLKKGISEYFRNTALDEARDRMLRLESLLQEFFAGKPLPSFGYNGAEALYSIEGGNTPNSVFPIFWWPYLKTGKPRDTLCHRYKP